MDAPALAAWVAVVLLAVVALFQAALALGAPWGAAAYGGRAADASGRLPGRYRAASAVAVLVLAAAAVVLLAAAGVVDVDLSAAVLTAGPWALAAFFALNTLGNLRGRHPLERVGFSLVTAVLALCCVVVALA